MLLTKREIQDIIDAVKHYQTYNVSINSDRYSEYQAIVEKLENFFKVVKDE
jgi:hypothetical protein